MCDKFVSFLAIAWWTPRETANAAWNTPIALVSSNRSGCNLVWAILCLSPIYKPIFSRIGEEMPEKWLIIWKLSNLFNNSQNRRFLCHFSTDLAKNWCVIRFWLGGGPHQITAGWDEEHRRYWLFHMTFAVSFGVHKAVIKKRPTFRK